MPLIQRVPWRVQPQVAVGIDWSNPLARGLISAWTPATGLVLPGRNVPANGGTPTASKYGAGRAFNGTSDAISLGGEALAHGSSSRFALIRVGSAVSTRTISAGGNGGTGFRLNGTGVEIVITGVSVALAAAGAVAASGLYALGISCATSDLEIFKDGVSIASTSASGPGTTDNNTDYLGQNGAGAQFFDGSLFLHLSWNRRLSAAEHARINANPWQLFAPLQRTISAPAAAGGAYTLTADAGSYSLAGQDATLLKSKVVTADAGSYALAGQDATLTHTPFGSTYTLTCDAGAYSISGQDAALIRGRVVIADAGDYSLTGQDAAFAYSGAPVEPTTRRHAGGYKLRKGYLIKGRRYFLSDDELAVHIAHMLQEVSRGEVKEITAGKPKVISKRTWDAIKPMERLNVLSDMLAIDSIAEDDDEETLLMLM